jgi:predicted RNase H-like nuclease (RuvC/YqgF family)
MRKELADQVAKENAKQTEAEELQAEVARLNAINMEYYAQATTFQRQFEHEKALQNQLKMLKENRDHILDGFKEMTG